MKKINKYQFGNLVMMPMIAPKDTEGGKQQRKILSYLPLNDVIVDTEEAMYNPTGDNIAAAGFTAGMNILGAKYLRYLTKGSRKIKQLAKAAEDKYNEIKKLYEANQKSVIRSKSTREEANNLRNQLNNLALEKYDYNRIGDIVSAPEYFMYSIWPFLDASINHAQNMSKQKQGGILEFLKKGSGIHIKKKNRGKFTSYCGGNVTSACIAKAKRSGNPTLVKRATFAQNSRHWSKHKNGGQIIQQFKMRRLLSNLIK